MRLRLAQIAASALVLFAAGYALWPPRLVYWTGVAELIGETLTMAVVFVAAGLVGVAMARLSGVAVSNLAVGGAIAYVVGMALVESLVTPDSPVHFHMYGAYLVCALVGAVLTREFLGSASIVERDPGPE